MKLFWKRILLFAGIFLAGISWVGILNCRAENMTFIANGRLRLGADLDIGGSVTWLSDNDGTNMINSFDWGRQIQMSFYSGPKPFEPRGKKASPSWADWSWNPIQSGDCYGNRAKVLAHRNDGKQIYVKCRPMQWALNNEPGDCFFECWYRLEGSLVQVRSRLTNARGDKKQYAAHRQELPAIYTNGRWYKLVAYKGDRPFSGDKLTVLVDRDDGKGWPWRNFYTPERWVALVDENNRGLGVYIPFACEFTGGFAGAPKGSGGPRSSQTGYMGPTISEVLDHNIVYTYDYTLIAGSLDEIRDYVYKSEGKRVLPGWEFKSDRQHWVYENITDAGWPVSGALRFRLGEKPGAMVSPKTFWRAEDAPVLRLRAGFRTDVKSAIVLIRKYDSLDAGDWAQWGPERDKRPEPAPAIVIPFKIEGDGKVRDLKIDLAASPEYRGAMTQVRIQIPAGKGTAEIHTVQLLQK